jgi:hypothetical protein
MMRKGHMYLYYSKKHIFSEEMSLGLPHYTVEMRLWSLHSTLSALPTFGRVTIFCKFLCCYISF